MSGAWALAPLPFFSRRQDQHAPQETASGWGLVTTLVFIVFHCNCCFLWMAKDAGFDWGSGYKISVEENFFFLVRRVIDSSEEN